MKLFLPSVITWGDEFLFCPVCSLIIFHLSFVFLSSDINLSFILLYLNLFISLLTLFFKSLYALRPSIVFDFLNKS